MTLNRPKAVAVARFAGQKPDTKKTFNFESPAQYGFVGLHASSSPGKLTILRPDIVDVYVLDESRSRPALLLRCRETGESYRAYITEVNLTTCLSLPISAHFINGAKRGHHSRQAEVAAFLESGVGGNALCPHIEPK